MRTEIIGDATLILGDCRQQKLFSPRAKPQQQRLELDE